MKKEDPAMTAIRVEAFLILHSAGWSDARISKAVREPVLKVRSWRISKDLPINPPSNQKINDGEARKMLSDGANDRQIADRFGTHPSAVVFWRQRRNLEPNFPCHRMSAQELKLAKKMILEGASRRQVAEATGLKDISSVRDIRAKLQGENMRKTGQTTRRISQRIRKDPRVLRRIEKAIGLNVPDDIRTDATMDLYASVLEGLVSADLIEKVAPTYRNRAYSMCGSKFGPRSLDEDLGEGLSLMDALEDPAALEEMESSADYAWETRQYRE